MSSKEDRSDRVLEMGEGKRKNSVWKNKMEACLNVEANTFFLNITLLPTRFRVQTAGRIRGKEGKIKK